MILRLLGPEQGLRRDVEWTLGRIPAVAEQIHYDDEWLRVTAVAWGIRQGQDGALGYDVALTVSASSCPPGLVVRDAVH